MILQKDVTPDSLLATLMELFKNKELREDMSAKARALAKPGALEKIAVMVLELSH